MSKLTLYNSVRYSLFPNKNRLVASCTRWYCKSGDESSDSKGIKDQNETITEEKSKQRLSRLNSLLKEMIEDAPKKSEPLELAKPKPKPRKVDTSLNVEKKPEDIVSAAKKVAESLGGDEKKTEMDLLKNLLGTKENESSDAITNLSDIFKGMKIDRSKPQTELQSRSEQVRQIMRQKSPKQFNQRRVQPSASMKYKTITTFDNIDLFGSKPLGIFTKDPSEYKDNEINGTWKTFAEREFKQLVTHPPSNYFQQMILWTEQGKLWKFPIDNEQGFEEEQNVSFADHIFLDKYLEPWCPQKGPIRHFMELVCVGLSKNPYLTVAAKKEHIEWYRNYFEDKQKLLKDVGITLNERIESK